MQTALSPPPHHEIDYEHTKQQAAKYEPESFFHAFNHPRTLEPPCRDAFYGVHYALSLGSGTPLSGRAAKLYDALHVLHRGNAASAHVAAFWFRLLRHRRINVMVSAHRVMVRGLVHMPILVMAANFHVRYRAVFLHRLLDGLLILFLATFGFAA